MKLKILKSIVFLLMIMPLGHQIHHQPQSNHYIEEIRTFQIEMNNEFKNPELSPLTPDDLQKFSGLQFYEIDSNYKVVASLTYNIDTTQFEMKTTTTRRPKYRKYAMATFILNKKIQSITLYKNIDLSKKAAYKNHLFVLFTDETSGNGSYAGGRYLDLTTPIDSNTIIIDFNKAYNPYCAYNTKYSCPIPSNEDHISDFIKAGVKDFEKKH
jgi:uncharacterized protein (DUF1684 family)